ncbi:MAG: glycerol-3-phosphate dehydrogenase [Acidobacteria bacterium RIFCSPLOWO2_12_FULL_54_10]|nr:MAG: glycerol-3-phosphate dehydrogenase [Acidobacteria bacterium RIFCSPLOWO2_12_FULL_54_10]
MTQNQPIHTIAIIGAGGWGTALSIVLAKKVNTIRLWVYEPDLCATIATQRANPIYLPGFLIPPNVTPTNNIAEAVTGSDLVILVVPSGHLREVVLKIAPSIKQNQIFLSATKGLERRTHLRMSEVIAEALPLDLHPRIAVLSGPSFAKEVASELPAAVVVASANLDLASLLQQNLSSSSLRLYTNTDVTGVELGGALKNIIAIGAGLCEGLGLGSNAIAALITRGLAEMTRLACACGARRDTLSGLSGMGDLVLTCTGALSRNHWVGLELGRGRTLNEILASMSMVAEGIETTAAARDLARQKNVTMSIADQIYSVLYENQPARDAVSKLMERTLKAEF